jgi:hypothetical protein
MCGLLRHQFSAKIAGGWSYEQAVRRTNQAYLSYLTEDEDTTTYLLLLGYLPLIH